MAGQKPPWSDLPEDLLYVIAVSLKSNPMHIIAFRSVCRSWRSSCPPLPKSSILSPPLPLSIIIPSDFCYCLCCDPHFFLSVTVIYALHRPLQSSRIESSLPSPDAWILFVDELTPGKLSIRQPFSVGSYSTPFNFPDNINFLDFNVHELGRFHILSYLHNLGFHRCQSIWKYKLSKRYFHLPERVRKVVKFPNAPVAVALHIFDELLMFRLDVGINVELTKCRTKHNGKDFPIDDVVEFNGRVLTIDRRTRVFQINSHSSELIPFADPIASAGGRRKRLVESLGRLYLVVRWRRESLKLDYRIKFKVYELNEEGKKWVEITSLGDRSFLFGYTFSFSASAQELGTYVKNCIFFEKDSFQAYSGSPDSYWELSQFSTSGLDIGVLHLDDADHFGEVESCPVYSDSLWPPPSWIWSSDRLVRIALVESAIGKMLDKVYEKLKILVESSGDYSVDLGKRVLEAMKKVHSLKRTVVRYHQEDEDRESMDFFNEGFMHILNKVHKLFEEMGIWSHEMPKDGDTFGCPDCIKISHPCHDCHLCSTTSISRKRHAFLFHIEEQLSEVEISLEALIAPVPSK